MYVSGAIVILQLAGGRRDGGPWGTPPVSVCRCVLQSANTLFVRCYEEVNYEEALGLLVVAT